MDRVPRGVDLLLPLAVALGGSAEVVASGYAPIGVAIVTLLIGAGALAWLRTQPLAAGLAVGGTYALTPLLGFDVSQMAAWLPAIAVACFGIGLFASRRWAGLLVVLAVFAATLASLALLTEFEPNPLFGTFMGLVPWGLGVWLRRALEDARSAGELAQRSAVEAELEPRRATLAERRRIAVELEDLLAHALGAMVVQAAAAGDLVGRDAAAARRVLFGVAETGRMALLDTAALLRVLRQDGDRPAAEVEPAAPAQGSPRFSPLDALLPAAVGALASLEILTAGDEGAGLALAAFWLGSALLVARRVVPLAMPVGVAGTLALARLLGAPTDDPVAGIPLLGIAFFSAGRHVRPSRLWLGAAGVGAGMALLLTLGGAAEDALLTLPLGLASWGLGLTLRTVLGRAAEHAAAAERSRLEGLTAAEQEVTAERRRIARELHDVLARSLSVMSVQASLAAELAVEDPEASLDAVSRVEAVGRTGLGETGRLLGLAGAVGDRTGTEPQHGLGGLGTLAREYRRAGIGVDLQLSGVEDLPAGLDLSLYRIVEEGLTNSLKHARGSSARVVVRREGDWVRAEVLNGAGRVNGGPPLPGGHGLVGVRERVELFGGELSTGPTEDGGYRLAVRIPVSGR